MNTAERNQRIWEEHWQAAITSSPIHRRRKQPEDSMQRWNKMATDFADRTSDQKNKKQQLKTVKWLQESGALTGDTKVLDIGAGPGNWSLLLAKSGAHVTALEPADSMADILQNRIEMEEVDNIVIDRRTWQEIDLVKEQWTEAFDLVFASMTPGIDGPKSLGKMMAVSRGFCYLSSFSGRNWQQWYGDLWRSIFNEKLDGHANDIINPFNLVYAMGYRPELRFNFWEHTTNWSRQKAIEDFSTHLEMYTELTGEMEEIIASYVDDHCHDDTFSQARNGCQGMMVWNMNKRT